MITETNNPAPGSPPDQATQELESPQTVDAGNPAEGDQGDDPPVDDTEEVEHEGQKYRVPKAVKPLLMLHADYTRKTTEVAEMRKAVEAERETFGKSAQAERHLLLEGREVVALDWQIEQLKSVDLAALQQSDPQRAQQVFWQLQQIQGVRDAKARELQHKIAERQSQAERDSANRRNQAQEIVARDVEGWSPELASKLASFAMKDLGFTQQELAMVEDPRIVKLLHSAYLGSQAVHRLKSAGAPAAPQPQPSRTVGGGNAPATRNPDRMSVEEWMKHRNAQLRKR
jgi:hypothetical protein